MLAEAQLSPAIFPLSDIGGIAMGETISPSTPLSSAGIVSMCDTEKIDHITTLLQHDEMEAIEVLAPVFRQARTFTDVFKQYKPIILVLRNHFCHPGRKEAGKITWAQVVHASFGISLRRVQQLLALPRAGTESDPERKTRKEQQVDAILLPAIRMAHSILGLDEHSAEDPSGELRKAALRALATELLNTLRRSQLPIKITICPLRSGDVDGLYKMLVRCFETQMDQVFEALNGDELQRALEELAEDVGGRYQNSAG